MNLKFVNKTFYELSQHSSVGGARGLPFDSDQCVCRYVEEIGLAAMPAGKSSAGVAREVNLSEHLILLICLHQVQIRQNPLLL